MKTILFIFLFTLTSCASRSIKQADLDSWVGQSTVILESHPVFSALPRDQRVIPDSNERIINYTDKYLIDYGYNDCFPAAGYGRSRYHGYGYHPYCPSHSFQEFTCVHQFRVQNQTILNYRIVGEGCFSECKNRPEGKCPK